MPSRSPSPPRGRARTRSVTPDSRSPSRRRSYSSRSRRSISRSRSRSPAPRSTKIVVERLSKNVNEDHLKEIFGVFGPIRDLDLPMNRQYGTNRGTAYILYEVEADAEAAIAHMHESHIDGGIINVSIVLPRRKFSPSPPTRHAPEPRGGRAPMRGRGGRSNFDTYRPRSMSRSRSPRRSRSYSSRSRTPPRRRGGYRDSPGRNGGGRRRSPSVSSYSSRSRSRSRDRGTRGRR